MFVDYILFHTECLWCLLSAFYPTFRHIIHKQCYTKGILSLRDLI